MSIASLIEKIKTQPTTVEFDEVIATIADHYRYTPSRFSNGVADDQVVSEAGNNEGSCKIFAFAQLNQLSKAETVACFGNYYRGDVLGHPEGNDHANIRAFMRHGWRGIQFQQPPLARKE